MRPVALRRLLAAAALAACSTPDRAAESAAPAAASAPPSAPAPASLSGDGLALRVAHRARSEAATDAGASDSAVAGAVESAPGGGAGAPVATAQTAQAANPAAMLIRTGSASLEVDSLDAAVARVRALAARLGGYVGNTALAGGRGQLRAATLELKLPAARFDEALAGLAPLGRVDSVTTATEDVGEEFVDVTARAANARRLEARLLALVERRTDKLADVLAAERELARVREEIERYDGRLRFLRARAALSTLAVTVHERAPLAGAAPAEGPVRAAVRQAWRNFVGFVAAAIAVSGVLVPLGLLGWGAWAAADRLRRRAAGA